MNGPVCVCCGQLIAEKGSALSWNPNICAVCSNLADGLEMQELSKQSGDSSAKIELSEDTRRIRKAA
jgi:hypothetical protein